MSKESGIYVVPIDHGGERRVILYLPGLLLRLPDAEELVAELAAAIKRASDATPLPEPEAPRIIVKRSPPPESLDSLLDL